MIEPQFFGMPLSTAFLYFIVYSFFGVVHGDNLLLNLQTPFGFTRLSVGTCLSHLWGRGIDDDLLVPALYG